MSRRGMGKHDPIVDELVSTKRLKQVRVHLEPIDIYCLVQGLVASDLGWTDLP